MPFNLEDKEANKSGNSRKIYRYFWEIISLKS